MRTRSGPQGRSCKAREYRLCTRLLSCPHRGQRASDDDEESLNVSSDELSTSCCIRNPCERGQKNSTNFSTGSVGLKMAAVFILHSLTSSLVELFISKSE